MLLCTRRGGIGWADIRANLARHELGSSQHKPAVGYGTAQEASWWAMSCAWTTIFKFEMRPIWARWVGLQVGMLILNKKKIWKNGNYKGDTRQDTKRGAWAFVFLTWHGLCTAQSFISTCFRHTSPWLEACGLGTWVVWARLPLCTRV